MSTTRPNRDAGGYLSLDGVGSEVLKERPEDSELGLLRELGRDLVNYFFMSLRTLAIHAEDNEAVELPLAKLLEIIGKLNKAVHRTHFITVEGQIYLNDLRIKMEAAAYSNVVYLVSVLDKHEIGGITFSGVLEQAQLKQLLLLLLNTSPPRGEEADPLSHIRKLLKEANIPEVDFDRPYFFKAAEAKRVLGEEAAADQEAAVVAYAKGVLAVKDYFRAIEAAEAANPLRIRKIIQDLVDVAEEDPEDFLKLHTIHGVEDAYYNHCTNVAVLAVSIGRHLQLSRLELADLGSAAMLHDLGYSSLARMTEEEGRSFDESERKKWHPVAGFKTLLGQGEFGPGLLRRMLVTLEHHMHFSRPGGFPNLGKKRLSVYTRIIQVADHYDALVCPTPSGEPGLLPIKALERLIAASGQIFDPLVVQVLVNVVGRYPYGSLVTLSSKETGVVVCGGRVEESFLTPRVLVVRNADGTECAPREVDLATDRAMKRRIVAVLDPYAENVTPHAFLFDKLGAEKVEDEQGASVDPDAWTQAIWAGRNLEDLLKEGSEPRPDDDTPPQGESDSEPDSVAEPVPEPVSDPEPESEPVSDPAPSPELDEFVDAPEPWEAAEELAGDGEATDDGLGTAVAPGSVQPPHPDEMSESEVAACKAAQQEEVLAAFARGGEEAVASVAAKHWSEFWTGHS